MIYDSKFRDSSGAWLVGMLEKFDPQVRLPLQSFTWSRDVTVRGDLQLGMESASFAQDTFSATNTVGKKAFVSKSTTNVGRANVNSKKVTQSLYEWAQGASWNYFELASSMATGRPIDDMKIKAVQNKWQQDANEMFYLGDSALGVTGFINNANVDAADAPNGSWSTATADEILADVNALLTRSYNKAANAVAPSDLRISPAAFGILSSKKVSDAGNMSVLSYIAINCLSNSINGSPLNIQPVKYLGSALNPDSSEQMVAYTNSPEYIRYALVQPQRQPLVQHDIAQSVSYAGMLGQVEFLYEEVVAYSTITI